MIFSSYRRLLPYAKPFRFKFAAGLLLNTLSSYCNIIVTYSLIPIMEVVLGETQSTTISSTKLQHGYQQDALEWFKSLFTGQTVEETLFNICVFMFTAYMLKNLFAYFGGYFMSLVEGGMSKTLRDKVFEKLANLSLDYFYDRKTGQLLTRVTDDVGVTNGAIISSITTLVREPLTMIGFIISLLILNYQLALIGIGIAITSIILINTLGKTLKRYAQRVQDNIGSFMSVAQEMITSIKVVKSFGMETYEVNRFKEATRQHFKASRKITRVRQLISPLNETLAVLGFIGILWFGGHEVFAGRLEGSSLFFFLIALIQLMQPVRSLSEVIGKLHEGSAAAENVFSVLDAVPTVQSGTLPAPREHTVPIQFKNVTFAYRNTTENALENINVTIEPKKVLALVGPSGAGKTTFVDLVARFYDPTSGSIILEGNNAKDYELTSLRKLFGIVTQDTVLFHDSIFNNIAYGNKEATREMVIEAAKAANAHEFIEAMPNGYDTMVGDRGVRLSGGQRQRIAIARALVKNPPILIFDEATSALDTESEKLVQEAIERLLAHRTAIVIAHRLSTIQRADEILVFDSGKIAERGNHEFLLHSDGLYKRLYELQFSSEQVIDEQSGS